MMVLSALGAGALATLLVPPYREVALVPEDEKPVAAPQSPGNTSHGMTGIEKDTPHRNFRRHTS
jgi:hypothetical protein